MPTLNWIGKEAVVNHHHDVPYRTLDKKYAFNNGETIVGGGRDAINRVSTENKIIHGDNLEALKAMLPEYEGRIKCIYIDPPYNTGNSPDKGGWIYYDNVASPKIQKWLGQVVGKEAEDLSRHDKWLCMMYPRLKLLHQLLADDGAIFISIDDNEQANLKLICDEIFGSGNYIGNVSIENNPKGRKNSDFFSVCNDYLIVYAKNKNNINFIENIPKDKKDLKMDSTGIYVHNSGKRIIVGENQFNDFVENFDSAKHYTIYYSKEDDDIIITKELKIEEPNVDLINKGYTRYLSHYNNRFVLNTYTKNRFLELYEDDLLDFKEDKIYEKNTSTTIRAKSIIVNKKYQAVVNNNVVNYEIDVKTTSANQCLKSIFNVNKSPFNNPKNIGLLKLIITLFEDNNLIILDSFAGSGTTAHAVLNLNKQDGGNRKFILVEMEDYAETITAERVKRVINGYGEGKNAVEGTGGSFSYYELGEPIFTDDQNLNESVGVEKLREYIWYSETRVPYCRDAARHVSTENAQSYLLGNHDGTDYYFYYEPDRITTLSHDTLNIVERKADTYVVYADQCVIDKEWLNNHHIIFKKIPRDIRRF